MRRRTLLTAAIGAAAMGWARRPRAETHSVRLLRPVDLSALPLLIMEHERLIERTAEAIKVQIGSATELDKPLQMEVKGRHLGKGVPVRVVVSDSEIR